MAEHGKYWFLTKGNDFTMLSLRIFLLLWAIKDNHQES